MLFPSVVAQIQQAVLHLGNHRLTGWPALLVAIGFVAMIPGLIGLILIVRRRLANSVSERNALAAGIRDLVFVLDQNGTYLRVTETEASTRNGITASFVGKNVAAIFPPAVADSLLRLSSQVLDEGSTSVRELSIPIRGRSIPFLATVSPLNDGSTLWIARDLSAERDARQSLARSEARYRLLFDRNPCAMWIYDLETLQIVEVNDAAVEQYGYARDEFLRMTLRDLRAAEDYARLEAMLAETQPHQFSTHTARHRRKDGTIIDVEVRGHALPLGERRLRMVVSTDVTERTQLEARLRQSQKLEAVGSLAGGVAHDFNNMLTVVTSYGAMLAESVPPASEEAAWVKEILGATEHATALTHQLLAFSRGHLVHPVPVDIGEHVRGMQTMLARLIGEDVELAVCAKEVSMIALIDPTELTQVLMNLAINARDAMPQGGRLTIEVSTNVLTSDFASKHPGAQPGPSVVLAVTDTGSGMSPETQARIFEPFFTTKPEGQGTGLGLATVFGIVRRANGNIWVYSELGRGTTFKVFLPELLADDAVVASSIVLADAALRTSARSGHILFVEDDEPVRRAGVRILENAGNVVHAVSNGEEALAWLRSGNFADLIVTDTVMPRMGGGELADHITREFSHIPIVMSSGYTSDALRRQGPFPNVVLFVEKPYSPAMLSSAVQQALSHQPAKATQVTRS